MTTYLNNYNPFLGFDKIVNELFNSSFERENIPVNLWEEKDCYVLEAELAGYKEEDINLKVENHIFTIQVEDESRSFRLREAIDEDKINAKLENGLLIVTLYKKEDIAMKQIKIS